MLEAEGTTAQVVKTHCAIHIYDTCVSQMSVHFSKNENGGGGKNSPAHQLQGKV